MAGGTFRRLVAGSAVVACLLALTGPAGADGTQTLAVADVSVNEAAGTIEFTVTLSAGPDDATFDYTTENGTADAPADYAATSGTGLAVTAGGEVKLQIPVVNDSRDEPDQTFALKLTNIVGAANATAAATGTIVDDDAPPSVSIGDVTVAEGNGPDPAVADFPVTLSQVSEKAITVGFSTAEGTAKPGEDYVEVINGTLVLAPGASGGTIAIAVQGDTVSEGDEHFFVNIFGTGADAGIADGQGRATILDDDAAPAPVVEDVSIREGDAGTTKLEFTVTLPPRGRDVAFDYRTVEQTATASGSQPDYQVAGGALTFPASAAPVSKIVAVNVVGDAVDELDETFGLELAQPATGVVVATATGTIVDDDDNAKLSIGDGTADEGQAGTSSTLVLTVTLSPASGRPVRVAWATADGTAKAGTDYVAAAGALEFGPGETSKTISVSILGGEINEDNETVLVNLSANEGAGIADASGLGTIVDKNAPPSLSISDTLAREGEGASFTVSLAGTTGRTVTVRFSTTDGSAKAGSDYAARVGTLTFAPGEKTKAIAVTVVDDTLSEGVEDFFVGLGDAVNATIVKSRGTATIEASDQIAAAAAAPALPTRPVATPKTVLLPRMVLGPRSVPVGANGVAKMHVTCQKASPITCAGTLELERVVKPVLKLGRKAFTVKKGNRAFASIKLSARARALLKRNGTLRARVIVLVRAGGKVMRFSPGIITLTTAKK